MSALIQARNLHRYYGDTHAVNDVSIELHKGEILALLGPNGAGKSSCLQMLCGVLAPSAGEIIINDADLIDKPNQAKKSIGYLPDKPPLYPELTVEEYLTYAARLRRVNKHQIKSLRDQAIQRCGLEKHHKRLIDNLSKGYQQRVGIAQAIIHQPEIIILDEPTVGLDPIQMVEIRKLILELGEQHGIILSTHILPEVQAVCSRVQMIHQGKSVINKQISELKKSSQINLRLQNAPDLSSLQSLPEVESVIEVSPNYYQLNGQNIHGSLADISQHCVEKQWGLLEICTRENTLEQVFLDLISGEGNQDIESAA
ncbi:MAG: ABC transporter ATP-binding protein [endosymbiont of Galathealinum brachiosum]|uniref:ABC transporter ATP-binding protein n=1 Tax=endosymbiont of Galathealinum brachiosum TaxID=2200906 RepID=A0A370DEH0_9GAMM|nr:MAG: ABC transporter ATP-binding protein [endosymbiont of Galathealinum brachiosum]